jgi:hypothetical protein
MGWPLTVPFPGFLLIHLASLWFLVIILLKVR